MSHISDIYARVIDTLEEHGYDVSEADREYVVSTLRETEPEVLIFEEEGVVEELVELIENA